jgi:Ca2+-binding EF-hand superfamily protein
LAFNLYDRDKSGFIDSFDLKNVLGMENNMSTSDHVKQMIMEVDKNKDGKISLGEFKAMMKNLPQELKEVKKIESAEI